MVLIKKVKLLTTLSHLTFVTKDSVTTPVKEIYTNNDFTVQTFFSPTCLHCINKMPEIRKIMAN